MTARVLPFRRPVPDSYAYERAVEEQQALRGDVHAISVLSARPLPVDYISGPEVLQRLKEIDADERRDRYSRWQRRVTVFLIAAFYAVLFVASFQIGRQF